MRIDGMFYLTLGAMLGATAPAHAQMVFDNGAPTGTDGHAIADDFRAADDFAFGATTSFNRLRFWGLLPAEMFGYAPSVYWQILGDDGGAPGAVVVADGAAATTATFRSSAAGGYDSWQFDAAIGPVTLGPGVFWLALHDGLVEEATFSGLLWETSTTGSGADYVEGFLGEWSPFNGDLAFQLSYQQAGTTVPEPVTLTLLMTGAAGIGAVRRRSGRARE